MRESVLLPLLLLSVAVLVWGITGTMRLLPISALVLPVLLAGISVSLPGYVAVMFATVAAFVTVGVVTGFDESLAVGGVVVGVTAAVMLAYVRSRARLGVRITYGESMLVDLRDRLQAQGEMPNLPREWKAEVVHRPAGRASFSGDFLVATRSNREILELALVDVSGKGLGAGTRALLLSGAFGGLLGSMPPEEFLRAANEYVLRQGWEEGFATAIHLVLNLGSGVFTIRSAGHPPAVQFHAGSGRWSILSTSGGLLGVFERDHYTPSEGKLLPGDALMLYTDGLVETPQRDLDDGIDKLQGEAERLIARGFQHGARKLVDAVGKSEADDRALVLLWRT